jgi:hypothetical protein
MQETRVAPQTDFAAKLEAARSAPNNQAIEILVEVINFYLMPSNIPTPETIKALNHFCEAHQLTANNAKRLSLNESRLVRLKDDIARKADEKYQLTQAQTKEVIHTFLSMIPTFEEYFRNPIGNDQNKQAVIAIMTPDLGYKIRQLALPHLHLQLDSAHNVNIHIIDKSKLDETAIFAIASIYPKSILDNPELLLKLSDEKLKFITLKFKFDERMHSGLYNQHRKDIWQLIENGQLKPNAVLTEFLFKHIYSDQKDLPRQTFESLLNSYANSPSTLSDTTKQAILRMADVLELQEPEDAPTLNFMHKVFKKNSHNPVTLTQLQVKDAQIKLADSEFRKHRGLIENSALYLFIECLNKHTFAEITPESLEIATSFDIKRSSFRIINNTDINNEGIPALGLIQKYLVNQSSLASARIYHSLSLCSEHYHNYLAQFGNLNNDVTLIATVIDKKTIRIESTFDATANNKKHKLFNGKLTLTLHDSNINETLDIKKIHVSFEKYDFNIIDQGLFAPAYQSRVEQIFAGFLRKENINDNDINTIEQAILPYLVLQNNSMLIKSTILQNKRLCYLIATQLPEYLSYFSSTDLFGVFEACLSVATRHPNAVNAPLLAFIKKSQKNYLTHVNGTLYHNEPDKFARFSRYLDRLITLIETKNAQPPQQSDITSTLQHVYTQTQPLEIADHKLLDKIALPFLQLENCQFSYNGSMKDIYPNNPRSRFLAAYRLATLANQGNIKPKAYLLKTLNRPVRNSTKIDDLIDPKNLIEALVNNKVISLKECYDLNPIGNQEAWNKQVTEIALEPRNAELLKQLDNIFKKELGSEQKPITEQVKSFAKSQPTGVLETGILGSVVDFFVKVISVAFETNRYKEIQKRQAAKVFLTATQPTDVNETKVPQCAKLAVLGHRRRPSAEELAAQHADVQKTRLSLKQAADVSRRRSLALLKKSKSMPDLQGPEKQPTLPNSHVIV